MSCNFPQREDWSGDPVALGNAWTLRKGDRTARCELVTHPLGWELRWLAPEFIRSQVSARRMTCSPRMRRGRPPCSRRAVPNRVPGAGVGRRASTRHTRPPAGDDQNLTAPRRRQTSHRKCAPSAGIGPLDARRVESDETRKHHQCKVGRESGPLNVSVGTASTNPAIPTNLCKGQRLGIMPGRFAFTPTGPKGHASRRQRRTGAPQGHHLQPGDLLR